MNRDQLQALLAALEPFAEAVFRIDHYDGEHYDAPLYACRRPAGALRELLNGVDGEPITVAHLRAARAALAAFREKP